MKYDYTHFPENTEITVDQARDLLADYHAGKIEMDPRMVEMAERYVKGAEYGTVSGNKGTTE